MAGSLDLFDSVQLTASSEYSSRQGEAIDTLQIHHATTLSLSGLISLMQPGGRTVSANGALSNTGELVEVVPLANRAFTSATGFDRRCFTVECCNISLDPNWGISDATHERLAQLAADMYRKGLLGSLSRQHIIGHYEVPGTYATSCPGPSMDLDRIVRRAIEIYNGQSAPKKGHHLMTFSLIPDASSATIFVESLVTGRRKGVASMYHVDLLKRVRDNNGSDKLLPKELDIVQGYLLAINPQGADDADIDRVLAAISATAITPEAVRDAVAAALAEGIDLPTTVEASVSDAQFDAAFDRFSKLLGIRVAGGTLAG